MIQFVNNKTIFSGCLRQHLRLKGQFIEIFTRMFSEVSEVHHTRYVWTVCCITTDCGGCGWWRPWKSVDE